MIADDWGAIHAGHVRDRLPPPRDIAGAGFKENTMTIDELREMVKSWSDFGPARAVLNELITRYDLMQAAIVAMNESDLDIADAEVKALVAHTAPEKRPYTVEDIKRGISNVDWHYIYCGEYGYSTSGWCKQRPDGSCFKKEVADVIYAGLRATNNLPEEYK